MKLGRSVLRHVALALGGLLILASCDSTNPLSNPGDAKPDPGLAGVWRMKEGEEVHYYHIGRFGGKAPDAVMLVAAVTHSSNGTLERAANTVLFPTKLGSARYLNVAGDLTDAQYDKLHETGWSPDLFKSYLLFKYQLDGDTLLLWTMDDDAKAKAIKAGKIKGETPKDGRPTLTDTTENLARWVQSEGDALFKPEPTKFERQK